MKLQFLFISCVILLVSCTTIEKDIGKDDSEPRVYEIHMQMTRDFHRTIFIVDGVAVGESLESVRDYLIDQEKRSIIFVSGYKLTNKQDFLDFFAEYGFHVKQFWVPRSALPIPDSPYPGHVDLLAPYDKNKWRQNNSKYLIVDQLD